MRRLRTTLAFECRSQPPEQWNGPWCPGQKDTAYPQWLATVLDVMEVCEYRVSDVAAFFGISTGRLSRDLFKDHQLWQWVNTERGRRSLSSLRAGTR